MIRAARADDVEAIREVERSAAAKFRGTAFDFIADGEPDDPDEIAAAIDARLVWVVVDGNDVPLGFLIALAIAEGVYLREIDVRINAQGQGAGRRLIETLVDAAAERRWPAIWLRTFRAIAWNRPYYEQFGFAVTHDDAPASIAAALLAHERHAGFDPSTRCTMVRWL